MNKLYFTTIDFYDENDVEFEAEIIYYVDKCLDTNRDFIDDFEIKSIRRITDNIETPPFTKKQASTETTINFSGNIGWWIKVGER